MKCIVEAHSPVDDLTHPQSMLSLPFTITTNPTFIYECIAILVLCMQFMNLIQNILHVCQIIWFPFLNAIRSSIHLNEVKETRIGSNWTNTSKYSGTQTWLPNSLPEETVNTISIVIKLIVEQNIEEDRRYIEEGEKTHFTTDLHMIQNIHSELHPGDHSL